MNDEYIKREAVIKGFADPFLERKQRGKWIKCETADYNWCCSVCRYGFTDYRLNYCYDCGAKMEE